MNPNFKTLFPWLFYALVIFFLIAYFGSLELSQLEALNLSWFHLFLASLLALVFRYWGGFTWVVLLRGLGAKDLGSYSTLYYVFAKSWIGRYIPGTFPWIMAKIHFASMHGISKTKLAVSSLLEGILQIIVVMSISFVILLFDPRLREIDQGLKIMLFLALLVLLMTIIPAVFNRIVSIAYKALRKTELDNEHFVSSKMLFKGACLYAVGTLISGLSFFFITWAVYPELGFENLLFVIGASNLAGAVGMLAVFVPSGIGVREGVQLVLLSLIMPAEIALFVTVVMRLWSVMIDFIFLLVAWGQNRLVSA